MSPETQHKLVLWSSRLLLLVFVLLSVYFIYATVMNSANKKKELTRAEIAPLLVKVYVGMTGIEPPIVDCPFTDIENVPQSQQNAICQLWGLKNGAM